MKSLIIGLALSTFFGISSFAEENCTKKFQTGFDVLRDFPEIFDTNSNLTRTFEPMPRMGRYQKPIFLVADVDYLADISRLNHEFRIMVHRPSFYALQPDIESEVRGGHVDGREVDVFITEQTNFDRTKIFSSKEVFVSEFANCRVEREIENYQILRTLVITDTLNSPYAGQACIRAGILMGLGLNNLSVLMSDLYHTVNGDEYFFLAMRNVADTLRLPGITPGMTVDQFNNKARQLVCSETR